MQATSADGRISGDHKKMRSQCKNVPNFGRIWNVLKKKFKPHPDGNGGLANPRLTEILAERDEYYDGKSKAGKLGAEARWKAKQSDGSVDGKPHGEDMALPSKTDGKPHGKGYGKAMASTSTSTSISIPPLKNLSNLNRSSPLTQEPAERTDGLSKTDFQKFWGPVEKYLRSECVEEYFQMWFRGIQVLDMTSRLVVLAVPETFLTEFEGAEIAAVALKNKIEKSGTGFLRDRGLKLVSLESIAESPVVTVGEKS